MSRYSDDSKIALARDMFTTESEAEVRAEQIGCVGTHTHDDDGNLVYMPCSTHEEYEEIVNGDTESD